MSGSTDTLICFDGSWLTAVTAERDRSGEVRLRSVACEEIVSLEDPDAGKVQQDVARILDDTGIAKG